MKKKIGPGKLYLGDTEIASADGLEIREGEVVFDNLKPLLPSAKIVNDPDGEYGKDQP